MQTDHRQHYPLVVLLAYTGLRFCPASAVHWEDGDEQAGVLRTTARTRAASLARSRERSARRRSIRCCPSSLEILKELRLAALVIAVASVQTVASRLAIATCRVEAATRSVEPATCRVAIATCSVQITGLFRQGPRARRPFFVHCGLFELERGRTFDSDDSWLLSQTEDVFDWQRDGRRGMSRHVHGHRCVDR
jgi:hypothetical protein